ncbi:hypothetical protein LTR10_014721 [Elasticomyces elasticus]|uniref:Subtelomeric hrmA-associated cluster protein AFUB-079030/YDR124W-like helical bundle domain-containing protein n=1 Tax=Exophiala sideris TaxID=1016849 RepID=A0ABR0J6V0_9EURO|nr:hypothetical protein LTR10_014721 [Elasticomyces elasticus]KAK5029366.1 hypothetical protein LTS07_005828 [Exophiala sideris]KAK5036936.1 hypothetical protein LTR13_005316 [Exophiala sideris]KAK5057996.1 hypothetical protein LTR69_006993 [Exophiala sideris]KAK5181955.1 hypothetical protein LTR44_005556 [Eurotiomycetes sp. CCFEE 6388]
MAARRPTNSDSPLPPFMNPLPVKSEDAATHNEAMRLSKEDKQRYIINEIKKLLEGCDHFIGLVPGEHGIPEIIASDNLKQHRFSILGDAYETFAHYMSGRELASVTRLADPWSAWASKGKGKPIHTPEQALPAIASISYPFQRPTKRHRSATLSGKESANNSRNVRGERSMRTVNEAPALQVRVDDRERLERWFREAFVAMQQVACRTIAKIWIKRIHPKKQSTHPYNGGMPRGEPLDPNRTRPPYWPAHVIHREPDHIGRDDRTSLLVHLIMNTPLEVITNPPETHSRQMVTASALLECLEVKRSDPTIQEDRWEIIEQVCRARDMMEQYEAGEIDGDALVFLSDYSNGIRLMSNDSDTEVGSVQEGRQESEDGELSGDGELTPTSSTMHDSPPDRSYVEGRVQDERLRRLVPTESSTDAAARRSNGRRSRASAGASGARASSSMGSRRAQELPCRTSGPARKAEGGASSAQHTIGGRRSSANYQTPKTDLSVMMTSRLPTQQQLSLTTLGRSEYDAHTNGSGTRDMMEHMLSYSNGACLPPPHSVGWGMMGPDPPDHVFGIHPHMTTQPPESAMAYFGQAAAPPHHPQSQHQEMMGRVEGGMTLMDPMQYHDINVGGHQHVLPLRVMDASHQGTMSQPDINMDLSQGPFYPM